jgi:hypothetical protein
VWALTAWLPREGWLFELNCVYFISNFLNNRYLDFTLIMQFTSGDSINLTNDQEYFDYFI